MKKHNILYLSLLLAMGISTSAYAQDDEVVYADGAVQQETVVKKKAVAKTPQYPMMEVKGEVIDAVTKAPLAGVQIQTLDDNRFAAMTNEKGEFTIKVPTFATALYFHTSQYLSQHVAIGKNDGLKVVMISDKFTSMYDKQSDVRAIKGAKLLNTTSTNVSTDIEDNIGADVRAISRSGGPGYGSALFMRGLNSLNSNAQPLFVVDGIIRDMQPTRTGLHYGDYNDLLLNINPEDIDEVKILKNGTSIYGAKGANGVILINTKRGRSMATRIDANIGIGVVTLPKMIDVMNADQYRMYASERLGTYPNINTFYTNEVKFQFLNPERDIYRYKYFGQDTNWKNEVYKNALTQNYNINVQGGDDIGMYNLSLGYTLGESTAKRNDFSRLSVRFNTDITILPKLKTRFDMSFTKSTRDVFDNGAPENISSSPIASPTFLALIKSPFLNPYTYYDTGVLSSTLSDADDFLSGLNDATLTLGNPTALLANGDAINKNRVENTEFYAAISTREEFTKDLVLFETFSYLLNRVSQRYYRPVTGMPEFLIPGVNIVNNLAMSMFSKETSINSDTYLQYNKQLGRHSIKAYGGLRYLMFEFDDNQPQGMYTEGGNDKQPNISDGMQLKQANGVDDQWRSITWYANADYNYMNRYYAQLSAALESNSRFGKKADGWSLGGVRWGFFPSLQLGWNITNESWFPKNMGINYFLLRAGYEITGNDDINIMASRTSFSSYKFLNTSTAAQLDNIGNDEIKWEQTSKFNVGFKGYFLNNRLGIDFDYYIHTTNNLLTLKTFENPVAGINNYWSNGGKLQNTGYELTVMGKPLISKDWNIEVGASVGHYKNELKSLPNDDKIYLDGGSLDATGNIVANAQGYTSSIYGTDNIATIVGQPVGMFYGYRTNGVLASEDAASKAGKNGTDYLYRRNAAGDLIPFEAGDMRFVDLNGDGIIDEKDKTIIGNPNPDIYGNIFANVMWKNFSLYVGFNYSLGNDVFNYQRSLLEAGNNFYNQTTAMLNRWRVENQVTDIPRAVYGDPAGNARFSDRWIEDGSYLRLKTLRLTYKVPLALSWLQGLSVWAEANNLFTLTHYLGSDPEFSASNSVLYQGIDPGNVALSRSFTFGLRINL